MNQNVFLNIEKKLQHVSGYIIKQPSHVSYLTNVLFPYPENSPYSTALVGIPEKNEFVLIVPVDWLDVAKDQKWNHSIVSYNLNQGSPDQAFCDAVIKSVTDMKIDTENLALDFPAWTVNEIKQLSAKLNHLKWQDCDELLWRNRMIKSEQEIRFLHQSAQIADRGMIGALNHVEGTTMSSYYTLSEFLERVRVHAIEFGTCGIGHLNISQGAEGKAEITPIQDFSFVNQDNLIRIDYTSEYLGYWNACSRMFFIGKPDKESEDAFEANQSLIIYAQSLLKPGIVIGDFCKLIKEKADSSRISLYDETCFGHGLGLSEAEWPFITIDNPDSFEKGMVIVLKIKTYGPQGAIIHSTETYEITNRGYRKLSDFKEWNHLYRIDGCRANH
jgi:Xaa-Pro dipeptidase